MITNSSFKFLKNFIAFLITAHLVDFLESTFKKEIEKHEMQEIQLICVGT